MRRVGGSGFEREGEERKWRVSVDSFFKDFYCKEE